MVRRADLSGQVFGRLTVVCFHDPELFGTPAPTKPRWVVTCACGNPPTKYPTTNDLVRGKVQSCGCLRSKKVLEKRVKFCAEDLRIKTDRLKKLVSSDLGCVQAATFGEGMPEALAELAKNSKEYRFAEGSAKAAKAAYLKAKSLLATSS